MEELDYCTIKADRSGLVIHPNAAAWEEPDRGGNAGLERSGVIDHAGSEKDASQNRCHESSVDRVKVGQRAGDG